MQFRGDSLGTSGNGFDSYFVELTDIIFPEAVFFTHVPSIGNVSTTGTGGWQGKRIKINLPTGITNIKHKAFNNCNFYAQNQLTISANDIYSEGCFSNVNTLTDIIFTAKTFTNFRGWSMLNNCTANLVFPNATSAPPAGSAFGNFQGYAYVPDTLVDEWKTVSGWSSIASKIKPLSEWSQ